MLTYVPFLAWLLKSSGPGVGVEPAVAKTIRKRDAEKPFLGSGKSRVFNERKNNYFNYFSTHPFTSNARWRVSAFSNQFYFGWLLWLGTDHPIKKI